PARIRIAELELQIARLALKETEQKQEGSELRAKEDGVVTFVENIKPGDYVNTFQKLIAVEDPQQLRMGLTMTSYESIANVNIGMEASVTIDGELYTGKVVQTPANAPDVPNPELNFKYSRTVFVELEQIPDTVEIGDLADIEIVTASREGVVVIPKEALREYFQRKYVQVLEGQSRREIDVE